MPRLPHLSAKPATEIIESIVILRGTRVILDAELAAL